MISRALVELYSHRTIQDALASRGGTALHKLLLPTPGRYSEDTDLVQTSAGPIGPVLDGIREALDPWLDTPNRKQTEDGATLRYRFESSGLPTQPMRLRVEINTREHDSVHALQRHEFDVSNPWFSGSAQILTYSPAELLGTKLRALYQRKKGRDLFDLWQALTALEVDDVAVVEIFAEYLKRTELRVTRAQFERNLAQKERMPEFLGDVLPLLPNGTAYAPAEALLLVQERLVERSVLQPTPVRQVRERESLQRLTDCEAPAAVAGSTGRPSPRRRFESTQTTGADLPPPAGIGRRT